MGAICKICNHATTTVLTTSNSIKTQAVCRTLEDSLRVPLVELAVRHCGHCDFYQIDPVEYHHYDDEEYYLTAQLSETQRAYQRWFATCFSEYLVSPVAEIGPGDGYMGKLLTDAGHAYTGFEPAQKSYQHCQEKGLHVIQDYFHSDNNTQAFSTVIARQVLEHIDDLRGFLREVHRSLADHGTVLFEVPNIDKARGLNRTVDFCPEHLNYFSLSSLSLLFSSCNFTVQHLAKTYADEYLLIIATKATEFSLNSPPVNLHDVVFWGAGSRGITLCHMLRARPLYFVDSDANKHGKYIPATAIRICPPATLFEDPNPPAVVITSFFYFDEVAKELVEHGFSGDIFRIDENNDIVPWARTP